MTRRRRGSPVVDEDDEEIYSAPAQGYRGALERRSAEPAPEPEPEGELLEPTTEDLGALQSKREQNRNRFVGMLVACWFLLFYTYPLYGHSPYASLFFQLMMIVALGLAGYGLWSYLVPRGPGPTVLRVEPEDEIAAGRFLTITVLLQPIQALDLDPLQVRLVARRAGERRKRPEITSFSSGVLASWQTIEANRAVRLQTTLLVPEDAPPTSRKHGVSWRVEVSLGEPAVLLHGVSIRVLPLPKRYRERAERMKARGSSPA